MNVLESHKNVFHVLEPELLKLGFNHAEYLSDFCSLDFRKDVNQVSFYITVNFFNNSLGINVIKGYVLLQDVNMILGNFVDLNVNSEFLTLTNHEDKEKVLNSKKELNSISNKGDISLYSSEIVKHIKDITIPFFAKYKDINVINEKIINEVPDDDYTNYIPGQTNFKVLIIMKLCGNPKYEGFKNWALDAYKRGAEIDANLYGVDYKTLNSLVAYLDSGQYKKNQ